MSIKVMSQVWELDLPATDKLILLGFADHANDDGICRPSFARIAWKCGISRETVKRTVRRLRELGILAKIAEAGGPGYPPAWQILTVKGVRLTPFASDLGRSNGGHGQGEKGSRAPGMGVTAVTRESNTRIEDLEPKSSSAPKKRSLAEILTDDELSNLLFENFKNRPEYPALTREHIKFAIVKIRERAKTPPGSVAYWLRAVENFLRDFAQEDAAHSKSLALMSELHVGAGPTTDNFSPKSIVAERAPARAAAGSK
jgi:hypothetical protein